MSDIQESAPSAQEQVELLRQLQEQQQSVPPAHETKSDMTTTDADVLVPSFLSSSSVPPPRDDGLGSARSGGSVGSGGEDKENMHVNTHSPLNNDGPPSAHSSRGLDVAAFIKQQQQPPLQSDRQKGQVLFTDDEPLPVSQRSQQHGLDVTAVIELAVQHQQQQQQQQQQPGSILLQPPSNPNPNNNNHNNSNTAIAVSGSTDEVHLNTKSSVCCECCYDDSTCCDTCCCSASDNTCLAPLTALFSSLFGFGGRQRAWEEMTRGVMSPLPTTRTQREKDELDMFKTQQQAVIIDRCRGATVGDVCVQVDVRSTDTLRWTEGLERVCVMMHAVDVRTGRYLYTSQSVQQRQLHNNNNASTRVCPMVTSPCHLRQRRHNTHTHKHGDDDDRVQLLGSLQADWRDTHATYHSGTHAVHAPGYVATEDVVEGDRSVLTVESLLMSDLLQDHVLLLFELISVPADVPLSSLPLASLSQSPSRTSTLGTAKHAWAFLLMEQQPVESVSSHSGGVGMSVMQRRMRDRYRGKYMYNVGESKLQWYEYSPDKHDVTRSNTPDVYFDWVYQRNTGRVEYPSTLTVHVGGLVLNDRYRHAAMVKKMFGSQLVYDDTVEADSEAARLHKQAAEEAKRAEFKRRSRFYHDILKHLNRTPQTHTRTPTPAASVLPDQESVVLNVGVSGASVISYSDDGLLMFVGCGETFNYAVKVYQYAAVYELDHPNTPRSANDRGWVLLHLFSGHRDVITGITFKHQHLVSCSRDGVVNVYYLPTQHIHYSALALATNLLCVLDTSRVQQQHRSLLSLLASSAPKHSLTHLQAVTGVDVIVNDNYNNDDGDDMVVVTVCSDGVVRLWRPHTHTLLGSLHDHLYSQSSQSDVLTMTGVAQRLKTTALTGVLVHPRQDSFVTCDSRGVLKVWYDCHLHSHYTHTQQQALLPHQFQFGSSSSSSSSESGYWSGKYRCVKTITLPHSQGVVDMLLNPHNNTLVVSTRANIVYVYSLSSYTVQATCTAVDTRDQFSKHLALSPCGSFLAVGGSGGECVVYDSATGDVVHSLKPFVAANIQHNTNATHLGVTVSCVAWNPFLNILTMGCHGIHAGVVTYTHTNTSKLYQAYCKLNQKGYFGLDAYRYIVKHKQNNNNNNNNSVFGDMFPLDQRKSQDDDVVHVAYNQPTQPTQPHTQQPLPPLLLERKLTYDSAPSQDTVVRRKHTDHQSEGASAEAHARVNQRMKEKFGIDLKGRDTKQD